MTDSKSRGRGHNPRPRDLLPSWRQSRAKSAVLGFVESVTEPGASYWLEMIQADPARAEEQPYKAVAENDQAWLTSLLDHVPDLVKGVGEAYEGATVEAVGSSSAREEAGERSR